jgi:hypothetical protein
MKYDYSLFSFFWSGGYQHKAERLSEYDDEVLISFRSKSTELFHSIESTLKEGILLKERKDSIDSAHGLLL